MFWHVFFVIYKIPNVQYQTKSNSTMKSEKKVYLSLISCLMMVLFLSGCHNNQNTKSDSNSTTAVKVKVQKIDASANSDEQPYIGMVEESLSVPISFLISGNVKQVLVSEGQSVRKGQLLAVLNDENYLSAYQITASKEKQAKDAFNRLASMYKNGSLPEVKYVEIQTGLEQAHSMTAMSKKNMNDCKLYSPMSGTVGKRMIEPGMSIIPGNPVFQLVKIEKVYATVPIPENEIAAIKKGQSASVQVAALENKSFEGTIEEKGVMSNPLSHTYNVKIILNNPEKLLQPGMVCKAMIHNSTSLNQIVVPSNVIQVDRTGQKYLFTINPNTNKVLRKNIKVGALYRNGVIVTEGLQSGDQVIIDGYQKVSDNDAVQIVK